MEEIVLNDISDRPLCKVLKIKRVMAAEKMGALQFFEAEKNIPFEIKRIYYITEVQKGISRGMHAHKKLKQLLFCPYGSIKLILDNGIGKIEVILDQPDKGVILFPVVWRDMVWIKSNSVLCVAASEYYDENDYIRDYGEFMEYIKQN
ncbi:MAG: WxcM-like domain-containing protein [Clostridia bacterium]|nr:WxcM-like domain-containing protein [Clostridia bacterium]